MSKDAIVLLREQHKEMRNLFKQFTKASKDSKASKSTRASKEKLAQQILEGLTVHTYLENECMYPQTRQLLPDLEDDILESYEEHHVADVLCFELSTMSPDDERFDAKMTVLIEAVTHHMDEEEQDWFPKVREGLSRTQLRELGDQMVEMEKDAPRSPAQPSALKKAVDAIIS